MPDDDYDEDPPEDSPVIKDLRRKAALADKLEAENATLRTKAAISDGGLGHLNAAQQKALLGSVDGDPTPEALKAAATDLGFPTEAPPPEAPTPQVSADEQAAHQRVADASAGADASEAQSKTLTDEINGADSPEAVKAILAREGMLSS